MRETCARVHFARDQRYGRCKPRRFMVGEEENTLVVGWSGGGEAEVEESWRGTVSLWEQVLSV